MKNWDHSINQHVLVYQGKELELFWFIFVEVIKTFMGSVFFLGGGSLYKQFYFKQWSLSSSIWLIDKMRMMVMKRYSAISKAPVLREPHHSIV